MSKNLIRGRLLASMLFSCLTFAATAAEPLKVGFVYVTPIGQAGWTYQHEQARQAMQRTLGDQVATRFVEAVPRAPTPNA
jgi:simple sugar transport system substrate-binding protein